MNLFWNLGVRSLILPLKMINSKKLKTLTKYIYLLLLFTFFVSIIVSMMVLGGVCYEINDLSVNSYDLLSLSEDFTPINSDGCEIISSGEWQNIISFYNNKLLLATILICLMIVSNRWGDLLFEEKKNAISKKNK